MSSESSETSNPEVYDEAQETIDIIRSLQKEEDRIVEKLDETVKQELQRRENYRNKLRGKIEALARQIGVEPILLLGTGEKPEQDYSEVFQIIKSQEQQYISQLSEIRKIASTWLLGTLGGISILLVQKKDELLLVDQHLLISLIATMGALGFCMLWVLDRKVYHRLLNATILEGIAIENNVGTIGDNNIPTKVRTHTLRITGQLGLPISIFYLFPIGFLLFISLSFYWKFTFGLNIVLTMPFLNFSIDFWFIRLIMLLLCVVLMWFLIYLSKPESLSDLAFKIGSFEEQINKITNHDCSLFTNTEVKRLLENSGWNRLANKLFVISYLRNEEKGNSFDNENKKSYQPILKKKCRSDNGFVIRSTIGAVIILAIIIALYAHSLYLDSIATKITQDRVLEVQQQDIITAIASTIPDYDKEKIELKANLSPNICNQLNIVSANKIDSNNKTYCKNNTNNIPKIIIKSKDISTNQVKLIQKILDINDVINVTDESETFTENVITLES
ncbi:MAG: hypothetical protein AAFR77_03790 [Cyanobacteria bacterium J06631_2]